MLDFLYEDLEVTPDGIFGKGQISKEKVRMLGRLEAVAQNGAPRNTSICHQIEEGIWQIELGRIRVLWFYDAERIIILSHGFLKRSQKTPALEKQAAREAMKRYFAAKRVGRIVVKGD